MQVEGQIWHGDAGAFRPGVVTAGQDGTIRTVTDDPRAPADRFVLPGFIDEHLHGAGGADVMDPDPESLAIISRTLARYGVTTFLATTLTATPGDLRAAVVRAGQAAGALPGADLGGVHLEGPFIDPEHRGAQPRDRIRAVDRDELQALCEAGPVRLVTMAPELPGAQAAIESLVAAGVRVNIGHTGADYDTARRAVDWGADGVTHLFNAMPPLHHRNPGPVGLALDDPRLYVEIIADGVHLHPATVAMAFRAARGRMVAVTDAISAVGLPPGRHHLGELTVEVDDHAVRLAGGRLAGSILTMDRAAQNLAAWGIAPRLRIAALSEAPARRFGWTDRGRLAAGARADWVVLDPAGEVRETVVRGRSVYRRDAE